MRNELFVFLIDFKENNLENQDQTWKPKLIIPGEMKWILAVCAFIFFAAADYFNPKLGNLMIGLGYESVVIILLACTTIAIHLAKRGALRQAYDNPMYDLKNDLQNVQLLEVLATAVTCVSILAFAIFMQYEVPTKPVEYARLLKFASMMSNSFGLILIGLTCILQWYELQVARKYPATT